MFLLMEQTMAAYIAGHKGMVGAAIKRQLEAQNVEVIARSHEDLDLRNQQSVRNFLKNEKPDFVVVAAAKVGGIHANQNFPADFIYDNLMIECNIINSSFEAGIHRLLFLGSSCIYPRETAQPIPETALLTGPLEPTNEPYAVAKIAGIKMCESYNRQFGTDYRSVMPTNLYGPDDNFHRDNSHVIPGHIRRFHEAKIAEKDEVTIWGSGNPRREFLHFDDMAAASLFVLGLTSDVYQGHTHPMLSHINVGTGKDITICDLSHLVAKVTGYSGAIRFDGTKPDGAARKLLDVSRLSDMGWKASISLEQGLCDTYKWFVRNQDSMRQA